jgi:flagellar hook-length control protein FliK
MHIITSPSTTPNAESLTAFAQSMGLDEAAIQKLLGEGAPNALARTAGSAGNAALTSASGVVLSANGSPLSQSASGTASATDADPLMQALNAAVAGTPTTSTHNTSGLTTALSSATPSASAATQLAALGLLPDTHSATTATPSLSDVADMTPATGVLATNANATAGALQTPVPLGLSAAEVASIQHIEITTAAPTATAVASLQAAATLNNSAAVPGTGGKSSSTLDALSLLGGDVTEQSVSDLVAQFSHNAGGDDAQQQPSSGHSGGQGFGQALSQTAAPTSASSANNASPVATTTPMGEVYDQLSDKMATEMAARMHKQLSDGEWKMKFGLRPAHLGGVEIQLEMKDGKLNAMFQAENPLTRDLLQNSSQRLRDALENFGIQAGQMHIGQDSGHAQQNPSRGSAKPSQVGDNSSMQVKDSDKVASATESRNKANASLLDLYA